MNKSSEKLFVVRKYIRAMSAEQALKKEKNTKPDDVWVDDEWKKGQLNHLAQAMGFTVSEKKDE